MGKDAGTTTIVGLGVLASPVALEVIQVLARNNLCRFAYDISLLDVIQAPVAGEILWIKPGEPLPTITEPAPDPWALRPLEAAEAELSEAKNKLAVCARLYAMRFDVDAYPFDFGRMGKLAKNISGGHVRLCQFIWRCGIESVRGDPMDYITAALSKESRVPLTSSVTPVSDPQAAALARARENQRRNAEHAMTGE